MKFEPKISGTRVTDFTIERTLKGQFHQLSDLMKTIQRQETMDFILDNFRFTKCNENYPGEWYVIFDGDTLYKIAILENYPEYEKEMIDYFGSNWLQHYIRFNH